ncbi:MAG: serine hydrolase [Alphaproteobacteria bacterium]|nr:serine hydrolase [Alphaproteobacteria bacterium]MDY4689062.1 serine hydrolase [Alphaproteobacteria bacterium]
MKKIAFLCVLVLAVLRAAAASASVSSIMIDAENGDVMYEMNADERRYPASLTKLMTLYITFNALENNHIKLTDKLKVSRTAAGRSPSKLGVRAGETITVKDAIMAVIVKSANDCATVLAEHFAPTEADFAVLMTNTAHKLGMSHTTFKNASGLPNTQQKTTARDMAVLAMAVYHHFPQYYKWFSAKSFQYKGRTIGGHNYILKTFAGADGMKTGYTAASGYNIITSAKRSGKRVIAVTMGHNSVGERDKKVSRMMDKGLTHMQKGEINVAMLTNEINGKASAAPKATRLASVQKKTPAKTQAVRLAKAQSKPAAKATKIASASSNGRYAVQVGSFSDYQRARNYALTVKNKLAKKYAVHDIKVEKVQAESKTVYRSKVIGLAKNDANTICRNMKRSNQACLVTADSGALKMAQR